MNEQDFTLIIHNALKNQDSQSRQHNTELYFNIMQQYPLLYLQYMTNIILNTRELQAEASVLLRKNCIYDYKNSAAFKQGDAQLLISIVQSLLQKLSCETDSNLSRYLADCIGELACITILMDLNIQIVFEFMQQAIQSESQIAQTSACRILKVLCGQKFQTLKPYENLVFSLLEQCIQLNNIHTFYETVESIKMLVYNQQFDSQNDTDNLISMEIQEHFIKQILEKLQLLANQINDYKKEYVKVLDLLQDIVMVCYPIIQSQMDDFLILIEEMLKTMDEQLFLQAVMIQEAIMSNQQEYNCQELDKVQDPLVKLIGFLEKYIFPYIMQLTTDQFKEEIINNSDFEDFEDKNSTIYQLFFSIHTQFEYQYEQIQQAFDNFTNALKQQNPQILQSFQYLNLKIMVIDALLTQEKRQEEKQLQLVVQELIHEDIVKSLDPLIQIRFCLCMRNLVKYQQNSQLVNNTSKFLLEGYCKFLLEKFINERNVIGNFLNLYQNLLDLNNKDFYLLAIDLTFQIVQQFSQQQYQGDYQIQKQVIFILKQSIKYFDVQQQQNNQNMQFLPYLEQNTQNLINFSISLLNQPQLLQKQMLLYYCSLIDYITNAMIKCNQMYTSNESIQLTTQLINTLLALLFDTQISQQHQITDQILEMIINLTQISDYCQPMKLQINQLMNKFQYLMDMQFQEKQENLLSEQMYKYNGFILQQQKQTLQAIKQFLIYIPVEMIRYIGFIQQIIEKKQLFCIDFVEVFFVVSQIPNVYLVNNDQSSFIKSFEYFQQMCEPLINPQEDSKQSILITTSDVPQLLDGILLLMLSIQKTIQQCQVSQETILTQQQFCLKIVEKILIQSFNFFDRQEQEIRQSVFSKEEQDSIMNNEYKVLYQAADAHSKLVSSVLYMYPMEFSQNSQEYEPTFLRKNIQKFFFEISRNTRSDIIMAVTIKEVVRNSQQSKKIVQIVQNIFKTLINNYMTNNIKHIPVSQLLISLIVQYSQENIIIQCLSQSYNMVDAFNEATNQNNYFYFVLTLSILVMITEDDQLYLSSLQYIQQNINQLYCCNYILTDLFLRVLVECKYMNYQTQTFAMVLNFYFQNESIYAESITQSIQQQIQTNKTNLSQIEQYLTPTAVTRIQMLITVQ